MKLQELKVQKLIQCEQFLKLEEVGKILEWARPMFS